MNFQKWELFLAHPVKLVNLPPFGFEAYLKSTKDCQSNFCILSSSLGNEFQNDRSTDLMMYRVSQKIGPFVWLLRRSFTFYCPVIDTVANANIQLGV